MSNSIQAIRIKKILDKMMRFDEGVMSRRDWLLVKIQKGASVSTKEVPSVQYNRHKYNRLEGAEQKQYEAQLAKKKTEYRLWKETTFYAITKTEYDFFLSNGGSQLSEI